MGVTPVEKMRVFRVANLGRDGVWPARVTCDLVNSPVWDAMGDWGMQNINPEMLAYTVVGVRTW